MAGDDHRAFILEVAVPSNVCRISFSLSGRSTDLFPSSSDALTKLADSNSSSLMKTWVERTLKDALSSALTRTAAGLMMNSWARDDEVKITQQAVANKLYLAINAFIRFSSHPESPGVKVQGHSRSYR